MEGTATGLLIAPFGQDKQGSPNQPNPTQQKVLDWVYEACQERPETAGTPVLYLQGGVGSGKTRAIIAPVVQLLNEFPGLRALWGRQDFNDLRLSAMETFFEVVPPELILNKNVQEHRYVIASQPDGTAQIFFRELKDLGGLGSQEFAVIVITEVHEVTYNTYLTLKMRCRQANMPTMILMEGNPPNSDHWLHAVTDPDHKDYDPDITFWKVSSEENRPNLPTSYWNSLEKMPPSWRKKYVDGEFGFTPDGEPYYEGYVERVHSQPVAYRKDLPLQCGWDFGFTRPAFVVTQYERPYWKILYEVLGSNMTIAKFTDTVFFPEMARRFPGATAIHYGDPACKQQGDKAEQTTYQILLNKGILIHCKPSEYRLRKEIIDKQINTMTAGMPHLLVHPQCRIINDAFLGGYHYPSYNPDRQHTDKYEVPFHDNFYSHLMNALEYVAIHIFSPLDRPPGPLNRNRGPKALSNI